MRSLLLIGLICCYSTVSFGQKAEVHVRDSSSLSKGRLLRFLFHKKKEALSIKEKAKVLADTTINPGVGIDSLKGGFIRAHAVQSLNDSVPSIANRLRQKRHGVDTLLSRATLHVSDSVGGLYQLYTPLRNVAGKLQSVKLSDSLFLDSRFDAGEPGKPGKIAEALSQKFELPAIEIPVDPKELGGVIPPTENKLNLPSEKIGEFEKVTDVDLVEDVNEKIGKVTTFDSQIDLESAKDNLPLTTTIQEVELPSVDLAPETLLDESLQPKIKEGMDAIEQLPDEADRIAKIDEKAESELLAREEMTELRKAEERVSEQQKEYAALVQRYKDKKALQESIKRKAEGIVNEKLNKSSAAVLDAQAQIARLRRKSSFNVRKMISSNSIKHKPFRERIVPGISLSSYDNGKFVLETALQAGYRLSGRFTAGAGTFSHFSFDRENTHFARYENTYGYRMFIDIGLVKGFFLHTEYELSKKTLAVDPLTQVEVPASLSNSSSIGLGRKFGVSPRLKGTLLVIYRVALEGISPSASKINIRTGFDLNLKKRKKIG